MVKYYDRWEAGYRDAITELIKADKAFLRGIPDANKKRNIVRRKLKSYFGAINIKARIKWLEIIISNQFFQDYHHYF